MSVNATMESDEVNMRKLIISIQKDAKYTSKEKQGMIFALFNKNGTKTSCKSHDNHNHDVNHYNHHNHHDHNHHHHHDHHDHHHHDHNHHDHNHHNNDGSHNGTNIETTRTIVKSLLTTVPVIGAEDNYILSSGGAWIQIPCSQIHPTSQSEKCDHYTRGCSIYTECCRKFYSCRLCHDQSADHTLESKDVKVIRCHECSQIQLASNKCSNNMCKATFGEYYCDICKLWSTGVDIYHCSKCDICLKGKEGINSKHCDTCGYCMPITQYNDHECHKYADEICTMCLEDFKGCLGDVEKTICGHVFHMSCMEKYISHDICCPICRKTLFDMSKNWEEIDLLKETEQIPDDFKHWRIRYQCNDCLDLNEGGFSIYGNKCHTCFSYNTTQIDLLRNMDELEDLDTDE